MPTHDPLNSIRHEIEKAERRYAERFPPTPAVSAVLSDGSIVETVHWRDQHRTAFCVWKNPKWRFEKEVLTRARRFVPYTPTNSLLLNEVLLLPSEPGDFGDVGDLVAEIQAFVHRYVDVSPLFEKLASYYVLLSWVYDAFDELPYLRLKGDPGSGKTRFLLVVGSLCYKPIFASGASTVSPLFRILDAVRGTLIIDEGDFLFSDERAEIIKILNNGNARGFSVLRSEVTQRREINPTAYWVYGPKLIATRGRFQDPALESRCLTEEMGMSGLREDIPIHLPASYKTEALALRNKLLLFRFQNLQKMKAADQLADRSIEPRLAQVFGPLLAVVGDDDAREELRALARVLNEEKIAARGLRVEAQVLEVIREIVASGIYQPSIKEITSWLIDRHGGDYERTVTPRWVGWVVRERLHLRTRKRNGVYVIPLEEMEQLNRLSKRYGVETTAIRGEREGTPEQRVS